MIVEDQKENNQISQLLKDMAKSIDYLEIMNKDVNNITLNSFIPCMRKKYKLKSGLQTIKHKDI